MYMTHFFAIRWTSLTGNVCLILGVPPKRAHPYRRESSPPDARQTRSKMTRSASLGSSLTRSHAAPSCPAAKKEHVELEVLHKLACCAVLHTYHVTLGNSLRMSAVCVVKLHTTIFAAILATCIADDLLTVQIRVLSKSITCSLFCIRECCCMSHVLANTVNLALHVA